MARKRPSAWECDHSYPIEVTGAEDGRRVRYLGCGTRGPARESAEEAMLVLRDGAGHRVKVEA